MDIVKHSVSIMAHLLYVFEGECETALVPKIIRFSPLIRDVVRTALINRIVS